MDDFNFKTFYSFSEVCSHLESIMEDLNNRFVFIRLSEIGHVAKLCDNEIFCYKVDDEHGWVICKFNNGKEYSIKFN